MTRIDFYIIEQGTEQSTDQFICRLTEKAWSQNNTVYLHTTDHQDASKYDDLLWTFNDKSFVPHTLGSNESTVSSVLIGHPDDDAVTDNHHDVLINLHHETPPFFSQFERLAEIITTDELSRNKGRERYQFYRDRGYALETHKMSL